jgi:hypothetical protein
LLPKSKLATTSLTLGLVGWAIYLLQWCFDLSLGMLLAAITAGTSTVCSTILDVVQFVFWLTGIVTGHTALNHIKRSGGSGRSQAVWGLVLNYFGLFLIGIFIIVVVTLIATGFGVGILGKVLPLSHR